jgi:acyl-CoA synthetase (AMP-forming)/AMP-acid ligase II
MPPQDNEMRLHDALLFHAREQPDAAFARFGDHVLRYDEAAARTHQFARALIDSGLDVGDRIGVLMGNRPEFALLYYAAAEAGVVPVPLNVRLAPAEWEYILADSGARLLIAATDFVPQISAMQSRLPDLKTLVSLDGATDPWINFDAWLNGQPQTPPDRNVPETADLYQMYTSGTTGHPKGAILTHRAVTAHLTQVAQVVRIDQGESALVVAPMYHAAGGMTTFNTIAQGGCIRIQSTFDPAAVAQALDEEVAAATMVPAMIQACLLRVPNIRERQFTGLRIIYYGSSPIAPDTLRDAMATFRCDFAQAYGMTEMTAGSTNLSPADHRRALADRPQLLTSAGRPLIGVEVRIVDDEDAPQPPGAMGQVIMRGPQLMRAYWNRPDETAEALRNGWLHTGDAGTLDQDGYLYILDRVKDMIVSGGENVYPRVVEDALMSHPAVAEVAVIGVPDPQWGESVKALVVRRDGAAVQAADLIDYCRDRLAGFERPRSVEFPDELPRTASGKVLKRTLREPYWQGHDRRVAGS